MWHSKIERDFMGLSGIYFIGSKGNLQGLVGFASSGFDKGVMMCGKGFVRSFPKRSDNNVGSLQSAKRM